MTTQGMEPGLKGNVVRPLIERVDAEVRRLACNGLLSGEVVNVPAGPASVLHTPASGHRNGVAQVFGVRFAQFIARWLHDERLNDAETSATVTPTGLERMETLSVLLRTMREGRA